MELSDRVVQSWLRYERNTRGLAGKCQKVEKPIKYTTCATQQKEKRHFCGFVRTGTWIRDLRDVQNHGHKCRESRE